MKIDWKILKANADTERAQLNRILEDIKASIKNEAQATLQAANIQATLLSGEGISGMASAWRETFAKVTQLEGGVNALSQDVTALEVKVYDPATGLDATASAVQAMSVEVDTLSGLVMSSYTLALDVNGYIVGWKFTNDGTTGIVDFRADRFRISAPGSIKSVEFADGLLKSVNATHNLYMGAGFGVGDSMVMWYGTTALPSAASSSNGLFWIKNDGTAYFGGGLSNTVVANLPVVSANTSVTQSITQGVGPGGAWAQATMTINVNGKISGYKLTSTSTQSSFDIEADRFSVSSSSGQGLTWENGVLVVRANGVMTAMGGPFGVNNEFIRWFGPDVALSACARENAMSFETKDGIPYFGGILTKEGQSRTNSSSSFGNGTLVCPSHPSNGGRKKINVTVSRSNYGFLEGNVPSGAGKGSAYAVAFTLQRKIGTGSWATVYTHNSNSTVNGTSEYMPEFGSTLFNLSGSGGFTFEDTDSSVATVQYQVLYTVSGGPDALSSNDAGTPVNRPATQSNKITVVEDAPF